MAAISSNRNAEESHFQEELILSVTLDDEIIQFNQACEHITAFSWADVIHKKFSDVLLPPEYLSQWKSLLHKMRQTMKIDDFILPLKTKYDSPCQINWNGFFIKDEDGSIKNICLFGTPVNPQRTPYRKKIPGTLPLSYDQKGHHSKVHIKKHPSIADKPSQEHKTEKKAPLKKNIGIKNHLETSDDHHTSPSLKTMEKVVENTSTHLETMNKILGELSGKYDHLVQRLEDLEKKEKTLEKKHRNERGHSKVTGKEHEATTEKNLDVSQQKPALPKEQRSTEKKPSFFSDLFGYKRQHQVYIKEMQQLQNRRKDLEGFEAQLLKEKKILNARIEEFCLWRDKLEQLEIEIEKRRQELLQEDRLFPIQESHPTQPLVSIHTEEHADLGSATPETDQILNDIPQSAVIIQRGILKQSNDSFAQLVGYPMQDILERNFFDFIADEGLAEVERYYLNRLKGEDIRSYKTMIATKEKEKVLVEITAKAAVYNMEKAEIFIITDLRCQTPSGQQETKR